MKRNLIRCISSMITVIFISSSMVHVTQAFENGTNEASNEICQVDKGQQLEKNKNSINDEVVHVKTLEEAKNLSLQPMKQRYDIAASENENKEYTMADLNRMPYAKMVDTISNIQWNNITDLFQYNYDAKEFYGNKNRMDYLINSLRNKGTSFTADDDKGIPTIVEVLRAGFYLGYYNDGLKELNDRSYHDGCIPAIIAIQRNPNFKLGTVKQNGVISAVGALISNASCNVEVVNNFIPLFKQFDSNINENLKDNSMAKAIYSIMDSIRYDLYQYDNEKQTDYKNTPWNNNIDEYLNLLSKWALMGNSDENNEWLINNSAYEMAALGKLHSREREGQRILTEVMRLYDTSKEVYIQAADSLSDDYEGKDYYGRYIDINKIREDAFKQYVGKEYKFDDGKIIIKAGDKVEEEKIKKLYWASKEVQAQFFRNLGVDKALEPGNADDVLTIVLYNSPKEYKMNRILKGLDVNNGGLYIEGDGTFYTYERTPDESIYTLEELFRHEFTHYLQGRYLAPGPWGRGNLYADSRLTWFEEGGAEFFAGSTRTDSILPRQSMVSNLQRTDESSWYTANQTMHSQYGNFTFYYYGFALQSYMYSKDYSKLYSLMNAIRNNDVAQYDKLIKQFSEDANLQDSYKNYIKELINKYDDLTIPLVEEDYLFNHDNKNSQEIYKDIQSAANLSDITTEEQTSQFFKTFKLSGTFNAGKSQGELTDKKNMDQKLNEILKTLNGYNWTGYKTVTAYMVDYKVDENNDVIWNVVFNGLLDDGDFERPNNKPICNINGNYAGRAKEDINFTSKGSYDKDGKIVEYLWDFGDGTTSNEENPVHKYDREGTYTVTLTVKDDIGDTDTQETKVKIDKERIRPEDEYESEPNDTFENANIYMKANASMIGTLENKDRGEDKDIYIFEVTEDCTIDIDVENKESAGINWVVYSENDTENYVGYADGVRGDLSGSFKAKKGKYYICFYKYEDKVAPYSFTINGSLGEQSTVKAEKETENNNTFTSANKITFNNPIKGNLDSNDNKDIYYFDISEEKEVEISLEGKSSGLGATWLLYNGDNLQKYISYVKHDDKDKAWSKETLKPGRYYVQVYEYSGQGQYNLVVR